MQRLKKYDWRGLEVIAFTVLFGVLLFIFAAHADTVTNANPSPGPIGILSSNVAVCDPFVPTDCTRPNADGSLQTSSEEYPSGATPLQASATGTTAATSATLGAASGKTTYICGFSIRANATAAATGNATVSGPATTLNFTQWTAPLASGLGVIEPPLGPRCIPASATNTAIVVTSAAPGNGGVVSVSAWGYRL